MAQLPTKSVSQTISNIEFHYFKVKLEIQDFDGAHQPVHVFRNMLSKALKEVGGLVATGISLDILKYYTENMVAILRVQQTNMKLFWQTLTLYTFTLGSKKAKFTVLANSATCLGVSVSSRNFTIV
ncbi:hypothetical protein BB561_002179 [Smittium simulii]|uniref:Ribonucleases P/MRP subunit Pop8-like domain-containing protein n=1 Tax=Smittium simulii TaxID=133385 RepID=A0A2T9YRE4_9FUNG|nr:hypothetical protein BB561_002179 [Smittium simulii]